MTHTRILVLLGGLVLTPSVLLASTPAEIKVVGRDNVLAAMQEAKGYDPRATTNAARFQAQVFLHLIRKEMQGAPEGPPLLIYPEDWFQAFLIRTGITEEDAPIYIRLGREYQQHMLLDYRRSRVIEEVKKGPDPVLAANVIVWWPERPDKKDKYSYYDTLATPRIQATNHRVITYRLLDLGDYMSHDEVQGLGGRPTTGLLGALFDVIGEGKVVYSRSTTAEDGLQITRAKARKGLLSVKQTVTTYPDGHTKKGLPDGRDDLKAIEKRLKKKIKIEYVFLGGPPPGIPTEESTASP